MVCKCPTVGIDKQSSKRGESHGEERRWYRGCGAHEERRAFDDLNLLTVKGQSFGNNVFATKGMYEIRIIWQIREENLPCSLYEGF